MEIMLALSGEASTSSSPYRAAAAAAPAKRRARAPSPSPQRKRIRAATPIIDDDESAASLPELSFGQTLTTVAGPSSYDAQAEDGRPVAAGDGCTATWLEPARMLDETEHDDASVLFSETKGEPTEATEPTDAFGGEPEDADEDEDVEPADDGGPGQGEQHEGEREGVYYDEDDDDADAAEQGDSVFVPEMDGEQGWAESAEAGDRDDTPLFDPATGTAPVTGAVTGDGDSYAASAPSGPSRAALEAVDSAAAQVAASDAAEDSDAERPLAFGGVDDDAEADGDDDDAYDESSYHSGDSDEYEMAHRPFLERTAVKRDIRQLYESMACLRDPYTETPRYRLVDRLGEGTFSSVYLAHDCEQEQYENGYWQTADMDGRVALKKILVTSSPSRIVNELILLESLRGCRHVSQLISAFREEDQVVVVLPYHKYDDFRYFYKCMDPFKTRDYMRCLLRALKDVHARGIVHRDVKPANFLFDYEAGTGVLVDFGLAERYLPPGRATCQHAPATVDRLHGTRTKTHDTAAIEQAVYDARKRARAGEGRVGFKQEDSRLAIKTNRAGTRGFRAPEVLLKCPDQTVSIDIWSAGIMLLSILTHKFPIFNSSDDVEALMEIAAIFGRTAMERCALLHNRTIITNVPAVDNAPGSIRALVLRLNPHVYTPHAPCPTPAEARAHIEAVDDALDLCAHLLRLDSTKRASAAQALRHPFFAPAEGDDDNDDDADEDAAAEGERVPVTEGKCGNLHHVDPVTGRHTARFADMVLDLAFGQGIPRSRQHLCPEHEHWQERLACNPLAAVGAVAVTVDDYESPACYADDGGRVGGAAANVSTLVGASSRKTLADVTWNTMA